MASPAAKIELGDIPPIPGTLSPQHPQENLAALGIELTDEEFEALR